VANHRSYQLAKNTAFLRAAICYWGHVFPFACREIRTWERYARTIPDPRLKSVALCALQNERGNLEGATAFATFVDRSYRRPVARAAIAFQAVYDYVDAVSEQTESRWGGNTHQLHMALMIAVNPELPHLDYYALEVPGNDGGYLSSLVDVCRESLALLPSYAQVAEGIGSATRRIIAYQDFNHVGDDSRSFASWAENETPSGTDLRWWETGAAAGSSLAVFALMAAAAEPGLAQEHVIGLADAYFPWIGALHTLLDSLVDEQEDEMTHQRSLIRLYSNRNEAASRIQILVARAKRQALAIGTGECHMIILAAMVSFYLSLPQATESSARLSRKQALATLGDYARPPMLVLSAKAKVGRIGRLGLNSAAMLVRFRPFGFGLARRKGY
jgi:tetraprenyl-beta-curcumene synthase